MYRYLIIKKELIIEAGGPSIYKQLDFVIWGAIMSKSSRGCHGRSGYGNQLPQASCRENQFAMSGRSIPGMVVTGPGTTDFPGTYARTAARQITVLSVLSSRVLCGT